jgi:lysophospholipase L1-like esterase
LRQPQGRTLAAGLYRNLADARAIPLVENAVSDVLSSPELRLDALHPNERGHEALAQKTVAALREMGYVR